MKSINSYHRFRMHSYKEIKKFLEENKLYLCFKDSFLIYFILRKSNIILTHKKINKDLSEFQIRIELGKSK